jgi:hypothetical protein
MLMRFANNVINVYLFHGKAAILCKHEITLNAISGYFTLQEVVTKRGIKWEVMWKETVASSRQMTPALEGN